MNWYWTWSGKSFGYRNGDYLFTANGNSVGFFDGDEIYSCDDGRYLGEVKNDKFLIVHTQKTNWHRPPRAGVTGASYSGYADYAGYAMHAGYEDFPEFE